MDKRGDGAGRHQADDLEYDVAKFLDSLSQVELTNILEKLRIGNDAAEELLFGWKRMNDETIAYFLAICRLTFANVLVELEKLLPLEAEAHDE